MQHCFVKLAADQIKRSQKEDGRRRRGRDGTKEPIVRVELEWDIPMAVTLPIEMQPDPAHQPFPFLETTLADLGIQESEVKERVVWVDTTKTQVKNKAGKLKEKETTILEVRVKAQKPGDKTLQEVLYSTEAHTDRSFCRTGMDIVPWKQHYTGGRCDKLPIITKEVFVIPVSLAGENELEPVQMTMVLNMENRHSKGTKAQRDI
ncbi:uncharacterized protein si:ch211-196f5.2 [Boleophthalmus pectinirostris]|uniref:uncharacterized protein si:ch211-196f5.2 n=1 Tax=Boleophthalmus pectinirostris TaxID=150288 RepID=UPI00242FCF0E|nr:uncharacterized protein si:ch211-196f5.2 [Boleophthalmus pectinirostris]